MKLKKVKTILLSKVRINKKIVEKWFNQLYSAVYCRGLLLYIVERGQIVQKGIK